MPAFLARCRPGFRARLRAARLRTWAEQGSAEASPPAEGCRSRRARQAWRSSGNPAVPLRSRLVRRKPAGSAGGRTRVELNPPSRRSSPSDWRETSRWPQHLTANDTFQHSRCCRFLTLQHGERSVYFEYIEWDDDADERGNVFHATAHGVSVSEIEQPLLSASSWRSDRRRPYCRLIDSKTDGGRQVRIIVDVTYRGIRPVTCRYDD
jgi:hypothetical protein